MAANPSSVKTPFVRPTVDELGFDPAALRAKYLDERNKRLRTEGNAQYREVTGDLQRFTDDPYIEAPIVREPVTEEIDVAIVGGGFGGMLAAVRLEQAGLGNFRIFEKGGDFGGTWYWNRYPGAQCDIESYIYLPLLEETGFIPKEKYSYAPEIFAHAQRIGTHFKLYERACFQTQIKSATWDEASARWQVKTDRGDFILDNMRDEVKPWSQLPYRFVKRQSQTDPNVWEQIGEPTSAPLIVSR
jgi:cyclohexanone monooxygenase